MKSLFINLIFIAFLPLNTHAQLWEHFYGKPDSYEFSNFMIETYDKGILTGGTTSSILNYDSHTWLVKLDRNGDSLWSKTLKSNYPNRVHSIVNTADGGIAGCGSIYIDSSAWLSKPFAFKLDACGELEWCTYFETDRILSWAQSIVVTDDNSFLITLNSYGDYDTENTFLAKLDTNGWQLWAKPVINPDIYTDVANPYSETLLETKAGNYLLSGKGFWRHNPADSVYWLRPFYALYDEAGNEQWITPFGIADSLLGRGYGCTEMENGHFLCAARRYFYSGSLQHGFIIELDGDGNTLNYRSVEPGEIDENCHSMFFLQIEQLGDALVLAMPYLPDPNSEDYPSVLSLGMDVFNEELPLLNLRAFEDKWGMQHIITKTNDNKVISIKTQQDQSAASYTDLYLLKMNTMLATDSIRPDNSIYDSLCPHPISHGEVFFDNWHIIPGVNELSNPSQNPQLNKLTFRVQPNPGKDRISLQFDKINGSGQIVINIYSTHGSLLINLPNYRPGSSSIDVSSLPKGIYVIQVLKQGYAPGTQKFIKY